MSKPELAAFLRSIPMFSRLNAERLSAVAAVSSVGEYEAGEEVDHGDWTDSVWVPIQGLVKVTGHIAGAEDAVTVFIAGRGDFIGCFDTLCLRRHEVLSTAVVPSLVARVPRSQIHALAKADSEFSSGLIHVLNERLWDAREVRLTMAMTAEQRLARTLVLLASKLGSELPLTRRVIAELSGLARETAIRALAPLERSGVVRSVRGRIEILHAEKLERLSR